MPVPRESVMIRRFHIPMLLTVALLGRATLPVRAAEDLYPKHMNARTQKAIVKGLDYLAKTQGPDGNWPNGQDGAAYPLSMSALAGMAFLAHGNTTTRGPYAENVERVVNYLVGCAKPSGIITSGSQEQGRPMYGHGFAMMFLASAYG